MGWSSCARTARSLSFGLAIAVIYAPAHDTRLGSGYCNTALRTRRGGHVAEAFIVDAVRTPVGKRGGALARIHPGDLGAHVLRALIERNDFDAAAVDDVIFGCCDTIGPQSGDIARTCWLAAGLPDEVPGTTIDRQCGSSQQALHFAAQGIMSGTQDIVVAGGVQNMSTIPIGSAGRAGKQMGFPSAFHDSPGWVKRYGTEPVSQFHGAELIAEKWNISREDMDVCA